MSFLCAVPLAAQLFGACSGAGPLAVGYVEGDYVLLAPMETARVEAVLVENGETVEAGEEITRLERRDAELAVADAEAALAQAGAELADMKKGKRPEEIAVLEATVVAAKARLDEAERTLARTRDLNTRGIATDAALDEAETRAETAAADLRQAEASLAVAHLPARAETIAAAAAQVSRAETALAEARWRLAERTITAEADGRIEDVIRKPGDMAGPQAPVVSMLPEGAVRLKLYVPEPALSDVQVGTRLAVSCDGCQPGQTATVSYVAPEPEFTPPVIYSLETRQKLVHLVEATPDAGSNALTPGRIVDVRLAAEEPVS